MGMLMDTIAESFRREGLPGREVFLQELQPLVDVCAWSEGHWEFRSGERRKWNDIQNTSKDITLLAHHLLCVYREAWARL